MSEAKHTPGPWHLWTNDKGAFEITCDRSPDHRAVVCARNDWSHNAVESEANARLIAAAPLMLDFIRDLEANYLIQELRGRAQKIIAKVEGPGMKILDAETIRTLLDLLNPLHGSLDEQLYDERMREELDIPRDREWNVNITEAMERDLTQAVLILENRAKAEGRS